MIEPLVAQPGPFTPESAAAALPTVLEAHSRLPQQITEKGGRIVSTMPPGSAA